MLLRQFCVFQTQYTSTIFIPYFESVKSTLLTVRLLPGNMRNVSQVNVHNEKHSTITAAGPKMECSKKQFDAQKRNVLDKLQSDDQDRSMKGNVDIAILPLIDKINNHPNLYTTSSCAGRIQILSFQRRDNNSANYIRPEWIFQSHDGIAASVITDMYHTVTEMQKTKETNDMKEAEGKKYMPENLLHIPPNMQDNLEEIRIVCQGPILHYATDTINTAIRLSTLLQHNGIKKSTIRSIGRTRCIVSSNSSIDISFLLYHKACNGWVFPFNEKKGDDSLSVSGLATLLTQRMTESRNEFIRMTELVLEKL